MFNAAAVAAVACEPVDWRFKGLPDAWTGLTPRQIGSQAPELLADGPLGPICVMRAQALSHNLATMAQWCATHGVELAPHGKTHMAPQLVARQFEAGAWAVTAATISQVRTFRAFGFRRIVLANELVDDAGLRWLAGELDRDADFELICWVDSVAGVALMHTALAAAAPKRPIDVCVELGAPGARTGCRDDATVDSVAAAVTNSSYLRLVGVAGYEAALGHDLAPTAVAAVRTYLDWMKSTTLRLAGLCVGDEIVVTAGGSTHFDVVTDVLAGSWPVAKPVRTVLRSGAYLTHDDGLYRRTSPLTRPGAIDVGLEPAIQVWAQVCSKPEPDLALLTMGRRDISFDQDLPVPQSLRVGSQWLAIDQDGSKVTKLNDQHAFLRLSPTDAERIQVGSWIQFGISHPCTVFDKWQLIPVLDDEDRVVELIRTYF